MVNTDYAVKMIFDKAARDSANRPETIVGRDHIGGGIVMLTLNANNPRWKLQRKITWSHIGSIPKADEGVHYLHYETLKFLYEIVSDTNLQTSSKALWGAVKRYTYSNFATQMFGLEIPNLSDPAIHYIHETAEALVLATIPGTYLVDMLPILDKLPLFLKPWERAGRERFARDSRWINEKLQRIQSMPDRSLIKDSLLCKIVEDPKHLGFASKEEGANLCMQLTIAGSDTSQASTWAFLEAMMRYPEVQSKAHDLLMKHVGKDRVPVYDDAEQIPYIRCLIKETFRWRPPVALGQPHMTTADIEFEGMTIPKGSYLQLNAWALHHDASRHEDPDEFIPERYAEDQTSTAQSMNADYRQRDHFAFGAGRRVCSGYNVAERSLTIAILRILWAFEVKISPKAKLPLNPSEWPGILPGTAGEDMPVLLIPRAGRADVIRREFEAARKGRAMFVSIFSWHSVCCESTDDCFRNLWTRGE